jgi:hypothetical protein
MTAPAPAAASPRRRLVAAVVASAVLVAAAPVAGVARSQLQAALSDRFGLAVYALMAAAVAGGAFLGLRPVRPGRRRRFGLVAVATVAAGAYVWATGSADPSIRAVEAFHFVEYGLITFLFYRVWRDAGDVSAMALPAVAAFLAGIAEEGYQWFLPARVGELRDVWLNGVAIACALGFCAGVSPPAAMHRLTPRGARQLGGMLACGVIALAAFVHLVHLGTRVTLGQTHFDSRYAVDALQALARDREARWRVAPPLVRPDRLSREDQYMTEGLQHVQARNAAWTRGDAVAAWHENRILEQVFAPVLDTPSYLAPAGHRWPPDHLAEVGARAGDGRTALFVSGAFPYPIYRWPPGAVWAAAAVLAGLCLTGGHAATRRAGVRP